jgi:hypothetical protein
VSKNSKNTGLSYEVKIFREREWSGGWRGKWRARGALHHATARPDPGHATMWCGGMVGLPEVSQVPLCPIFDRKFKKNFLEFFEKLYFQGFFRN